MIARLKEAASRLFKAKKPGGSFIPKISSFRSGQRAYPPQWERRRSAEWLTSWVYICADRNATEISQQKLRLYKRTQKSAGKTSGRTLSARADPNREEVEDHTFLDLIGYVNPLLDFHGLMWLTAMYLQVDGNCYWHVVYNALDVPMEIWPLPAQYVATIYGNERLIEKYEMTYPGAQPITFERREIMHFRKPSPLDLVSGFPNLRGVLWAAETNLRMAEWESAIFQNYGVPDLLIIPKGDYEEGQVKQLEDSWKRQFGGWRNRGRTHISPVEVEVQKIADNARDLQFKEGRKAIIEQLAAGFKVPMNVLIDTGVTYNNMRHGTALWMRGTINPYLQLVASGINGNLMPVYDGEEMGERPSQRTAYFVEFDDPAPEDVDADSERWSKLYSTGIASLNQARNAVKLEPEESDWADEPMIPTALRKASEPPPGLSFGTNASPLTGGGGGGIAIGNTGAAASGESQAVPPRPAFGLNELTAGIERMVTVGDQASANMLREALAEALGKPKPPPVEVGLGVVDPAKNAPKEEEKPNGNGGEGNGPKAGDSAKDGSPAPMGKTVRRISAKMDAETAAAVTEAPELADVTESLLARLREYLIRRVEAMVPAKSVRKQEEAPPPEEIFGTAEQQAWALRLASEALDSLVNYYAMGYASASAELPADLQGALPEEYRAAVEQLARDFSSTVIGQRGERLAEVMTDWIATEANVSSLTAAIREIFGTNRQDAERIARTEALRVYNTGAVASWRDAGIERKEWLTSSRPCEFCESMNGRSVGLDEPFVQAGQSVPGTSGGAYVARYGDVQVPPLHPNCVCTVLAVLES